MKIIQKNHSMKLCLYLTLIFRDIYVDKEKHYGFYDNDLIQLYILDFHQVRQYLGEYLILSK